MEPVVVPKSKPKIVLILASLLMFGIASLTGFAYGLISGNAFILGSGIVGLLFAGFLLFGWLHLLMNGKLGLVVDSSGITFDMVCYDVGLVSWSEIADIRRHWSAGQLIYLVYLREPEKFISRQYGIRRMLAKLNTSFSGTPVWIASTGLTLSGNEIEALVRPWALRSKK
jgi:hypothetical protein